MNPDNDQTDGARDRDPLDRMLEGAAWPEPDPDRLARLQQQWRELSPARARRRRSAWMAAAIAIAAGLLIGVVLWRVVEEGSQDTRRASPPAAPRQRGERPLRKIAKGSPKRNTPPSNAKAAKDGPAVRVPNPTDVPARMAARSRPATPYERLVFRALTRRPKPPVKQARQEAEQARQKLLEEAIARRVAEPDGDLGELTEPLMPERQSYELLLAERTGQFDGPRQVAAIELLGQLGSGRTVPLLAGLSRSPTAHGPAVRALGRLADPDTVGRLAAEEADPALQQELLAALASREDARSVAVYLRFVPRQKTRDAALSALHDVDRPPVERLFERLTSTDRAQRTAAALALGSLDDPQVPARLIQMVGQGNRQEPLLALAASSQRGALEFVNLARKNPLLLGSVRTIEYRLKTLFP